MLVTETEAAERRCPNRSYMGEPHGFCLASMCMAWRFGPPVQEGVGGHDARPPRPDGVGWLPDGTKGWRRTTQNSRGYCGLAGNPTHEQ